MKEAIQITPYELVTKTQAKKSEFLDYHRGLVAGVKSSKPFEALIPEIVTPNFVALYGDSSQGLAVKSITLYVESLIPTVKGCKMIDELDDNGNPMYDEKGKKKKVVKRDANGKRIMEDIPLFEMSKSAYEKIQRLVNMTFGPYSVYWDARRFVAQNLSTVDEKMFDKMNDYLWRRIMAVVYPDDVKREFKHLCICIKRKLLYLGDRNEVFNQLTFGLYDNGGIDGGGTGKTTLLDAFAQAFSNGNPARVQSLSEVFDFNLKTADKFGVVFLDEDAPAKGESKDKLKSFTDSSTRKIEGKGVESTTINNLLTLVIAANHKISSRLYEDEARGQRRDAAFEVIGNIVQYREKDMVTWFERMFATCPIDDDSKTYKHYNPHSNELTDAEYTVLDSVYRNVSSTSEKFKLHKLADRLEISASKDKAKWWALRSLLNVRQYFDVEVARDKSKFYIPRLEDIARRIGAATTPFHSWWSKDWRNSQPYIDVEQVISSLESPDQEVPSTPITYDESINDLGGAKDD